MGNERIAIMQPYFFPYIGYFHLIDAADLFVVYDNLQYSKQGWINRNRFLCGGKDVMFSIPLKKASDFLDIDCRSISDQFDRRKLLNRIRGAYRKAPFFDSAFPLFADCVAHDEANLFRYVKFSIEAICRYLKIETAIVCSSSAPIDHSQSGMQKVIAISRSMGASTYINAIGGVSLYDSESFESAGLRLRFIQSDLWRYQQFGNEFMPWLSILDLLMFNSREAVIDHVKNGYSLVEHAAAI